MPISKVIDTTVVQKMINLKPTKTPAHLKTKNALRTGEDFDPNSYFRVLTHLSMKPDYTLDYVYEYTDGFGGRPYLYARLTTDPPIKTYSRKPMIVIRRKTDPPLKTPPVIVSADQEVQDPKDPLPYLIADGTPDSFFQLALFNRMAGHFYLFWHYYTYKKIMMTQEDLDTLIHKLDNKEEVFGAPLSDEIITAAQKMISAPIVELDETKASVTYCVFNWGTGFDLIKETYRRNPPHDLIDSNTIGHIAYERGIHF